MILIVEDDPQVARLIALVLQRNGFKGEVLPDGRAALERTRESKPEMVFADLKIQGLDGQALCSALKSDPATRNVPFIVISGDRDIAEKAQTCGADDFLGKPFEFEDLLALVRKYAKNEKR